MRTRTVSGIASIVLALLVVAPLVPPASATTAVVHPSLAQLEYYVARTLANNHFVNPDSTIAPVSQVASTGEGRIPTICFNPDPRYAVPAGASTRCAFGDLRSHRTILLFGDDNAVMWLPAFSALGTDLHWRIVFIGKPSCSAWSIRTDASTVNCRRFVLEEVAFATRLHARIVIPMGAKVVWRGTKKSSVNQLRSEITSTLWALGPSHSRVLLFQTIPQFNRGYTNWTPRICLANKGALLRQCEVVIHHFLFDNTASLALTRVSNDLKVPLIPTQQFFCAGTLCSLYVTSPTGTYLVYRDSAHISRYYSNWIFTALEPILRSHLI